MDDLHAVIMAGGSGTRFWPASRGSRPKQFLPLISGRTLIGATIDRLTGLVPPERIWVVTNATQAALLREVRPEFDPERILVEPEPRDTAPCIAFAAARIEARAPGAVLCLLPADHHVEPVDAFQRTVARAAALARADDELLVTIGLRPDRPATGYGYIEPGAPVDTDHPPAARVSRFREKPDRATAEQFLAGGRMLWNSGIFVWTTAALRAAMRSGNAELARQADAMLGAARDGRDADLERAFRATPKISVDYAVMERAPRVAVVEADFGWDDLGSFLALERLQRPDAGGNTCHEAGGARTLLHDSRRCVVYGDGPRTVALLGVEDLVVVQVPDAVLVCRRERAEDLKLLQHELRARGWEELL